MTRLFENKKRMNKRADITITILVIGVIAITFLTVFNFVKVNADRSNDFYGPGLIETMKSIDVENSHGYSGNLERGNDVYSLFVEVNDESISGTYSVSESFWNDCDGSLDEYSERCPVEKVKVIWTR